MNTGHDRKSKTEGYTDIWLTPKVIFDAIGLLDNDYCANETRPFDTALQHHTLSDGDGLKLHWQDTVFCNPPYSNISDWVEKLSKHNDGILLVFVRTDTKYWHDYIFDKATSIYFIKGRLKFMKEDGTIGGTAGAPSCLVAYGVISDDILSNIDQKILPGKYVSLGGN